MRWGAPQAEWLNRMIVIKTSRSRGNVENRCKYSLLEYSCLGVEDQPILACSEGRLISRRDY